MHDWLTGFRGGERVLEAFCELFPQAPLHTLIYSPKSTSQKIENREIQTSFLNLIPGIDRHYRKFLPLMPLAADTMRIREIPEVLLSSSHCVIKGVKKPKGCIHISYIHSPMRYLYDQFDSYFGKSAPLYQQVGARVFRPYLTNWDIQSNLNVDHFIANSTFVAERISRIYKRHSTVIHPFVDIEDIKSRSDPNATKEDFYLMVSAFAPNKRVDLAIDAFNEMKKPLKIIGSGQLEKNLRQRAQSNIEFLGNLNRTEVIQWMQKARGFIFPGVEDFGITPLESLACGTPLVAFGAGGILETQNQETAILFDRPTTKSLSEAIRSFEQAEFDKEKLISQANNFSKDIFMEKIKTFIDEKKQERDRQKN